MILDFSAMLGGVDKYFSLKKKYPYLFHILLFVNPYRLSASKTVLCCMLSFNVLTSCAFIPDWVKTPL